MYEDMADFASDEFKRNLIKGLIKPIKNPLTSQEVIEIKNEWNLILGEHLEVVPEMNSFGREVHGVIIGIMTPLNNNPDDGYFLLYRNDFYKQQSVWKYTIEFISSLREIEDEKEIDSQLEEIDNHFIGTSQNLCHAVDIMIQFWRKYSR